jgi:hypothetical protein
MHQNKSMLKSERVERYQGPGQGDDIEPRRRESVMGRQIQKRRQERYRPGPTVQTIPKNRRSHGRKGSPEWRTRIGEKGRDIVMECSLLQSSYYGDIGKTREGKGSKQKAVNGTNTERNWRTAKGR